MRFMVIVKANKDSEAGVLPRREASYRDGEVQRGAGESRRDARGRGAPAELEGRARQVLGSKRTVIDGPFAETKELIAGFWLWQVKSKEEAIEWVKRCPDPLDGESEIEIRQVFEASDFPSEIFPPEEAAREQALRDKLQRKAGNA